MNMIEYKFEKTDDINKCFKNFYEIISCLRDPENGCPWDKEQMPKDIIRSMQGEIYEYIDALSDDDKNHQKEEIGDIFLNLFLLLKIHDQNGDFDATDSLNEACEKIIRRHPHVFSNVHADNSSEVHKIWQDIKKNVEGRIQSDENFFDNLERNAPEIERCYKISKKAAKVGFEWPDLQGVFNKVNEELTEVKNAYSEENLEEELGDLLFSVVNLCRYQHIKPQDALQNANNKFIKRFNLVYKLAEEENLKLEELSAEQWDLLWNKAKSLTRYLQK